jgi:LCP family protein required for cell wall assembly
MGDVKTRRSSSARRVEPRRHALTRNIATTLAVVVIPLLALMAFVLLWALPRRDSLVGNFVNVDVLGRVPLALGGIGLVWLLGVIAAHRLTRVPAYVSRGKRAFSQAFTAFMCLVVALPLAVTGWYTWVFRDGILSAAKDEHSATTPTFQPEAKDPWAGRDRVTLMLLGGDGGVGREGIRTDTVIVVSIDVHTGKAVTFSLPRNLRNVPFPQDSPLSKIYPTGFNNGGDAGESMLNAIYRNVPALHPGVVGKTDNEGADALKLGVSAALGLDVDYYVLVNLYGFREIVDAMGGITVNINRPIPINGDTDRRIPPTGWLKPGPNQHLDGYHALWYARGRWGLTDYDRMERQRCAINAIVDEANPGNLLWRFGKLAKAAKKMMRTDIPRKLLPALAELAVKMKGQRIKNVLFQHTDKFDPNDPDYAYVWRKVQRALAKSSTTPLPSPSGSPSPSGTPTTKPRKNDPCAYNLITKVPSNPY